MKKLAKQIAFISLCAIPAAQAHVRFEQNTAPAGQYHVAGLIIPHGCGDSPTKQIILSIPEGVTEVTPRAMAGWELTTEMRKLEKPMMVRGTKVEETVAKVIWSNGNLPAYAYQRFDLNMKLPATPAATLWFPVTQLCQQGEAHWANIPTPNSNQAVDHPAPSLKLIRAQKAAGHH